VTAELDSSLDESNLSAVVDVIVKPSNVCPRRNKHNGTPALARINLIKALPHPFRKASSVWGIAEYAFPRPILLESVLLLGVVSVALVVEFICTRI
jgi:hypothetical protein